MTVMLPRQVAACAVALAGIIGAVAFAALIGAAAPAAARTSAPVGE